MPLKIISLFLFCYSLLNPLCGQSAFQEALDHYDELVKQYHIDTIAFEDFITIQDKVSLAVEESTLQRLEGRWEFNQSIDPDGLFLDQTVRDEVLEFLAPDQVIIYEDDKKKTGSVSIQGRGLTIHLSDPDVVSIGGGEETEQLTRKSFGLQLHNLTATYFTLVQAVPINDLESLADPSKLKLQIQFRIYTKQ